MFLLLAICVAATLPFILTLLWKRHIKQCELLIHTIARLKSFTSYCNQSRGQQSSICGCLSIF